MEFQELVMMLLSMKEIKFNLLEEELTKTIRENKLSKSSEKFFLSLIEVIRLKRKEMAA